MARLKYEFRHLEVSTDAGYDPTYYEFPVIGGDDLKLEFGFNQDLELEKGISSSIQVYGAGGAYIKYWLINHANAPIHTVLVRITDTVCNKTLGEWLVKTDSIEWCDEDICKYSLTLREYDPVLDCLKNTLIYDNHQDWFPESGFPGPGTIHPRFRYCDDVKPQALQNFIAVIAQGILIAFNTVAGPISLLLTVLSFLGLPAGIQAGFDAFVSDVYNGVFGWFLGCRRLHPSPFVRTYMQNVCDKCGVNFKSSIFNNTDSAYYFIAHLFAPVKYGVLESSSKDWIPQNAPIYTLWTYAKSLRLLFNAKYLKRDNTFLFERKDFFVGGFLYDFTGTDKNKLDSKICYQWSGEKKPAFRSFKYSDDAFDQTGNEAKHRFNDFTYFLGNPLLEGEKVVQVTDYSPQRYTEDGIDRRLIFDALPTGAGFPSITVVADVLLMSADTTSTGKLIEWDQQSMDDARTVKIYLTVFATGVYDPAWNSDWVVENSSYSDRFVYNYHMLYDDLANTTYQNLSSFWEIDNPTSVNKKNIDWNSDLRLCSADMINLLFTNPTDTELNPKIDYKVKLNADYDGAIQGITVDFGKNLINLKGIVL